MSLTKSGGNNILKVKTIVFFAITSMGIKQIIAQSIRVRHLSKRTQDSLNASLLRIQKGEGIERL